MERANLAKTASRAPATVAGAVDRIAALAARVQFGAPVWDGIASEKQSIEACVKISHVRAMHKARNDSLFLRRWGRIRILMEFSER